MDPLREGSLRYVRHTFSISSTWKAALIQEYTINKVLLRSRDFCQLEVLTSNGTTEILKVSNRVLPHLTTRSPCVLYIWCDHGCWQAGVKMLSDDKVGHDDFLMKDSPDVPPGVSDPDYVPLPDVFEPWAMEYEKFDRLSGFGLNQLDEPGYEPWSLAYFAPTAKPISPEQVEQLHDYSNPMDHQVIQSLSSGIYQQELDAGGHMYTANGVHSVQPQPSDLNINSLQDMEPWAAHFYTANLHAEGHTPQDRPTEYYIEPWAARYYCGDTISSQSCATQLPEPAQPEGFDAMFSFARDVPIPPLGCFSLISLPNFRQWWYGSRTSAVCKSHLQGSPRQIQGMWPFQWTTTSVTQTSRKPEVIWYKGTCHYETECPMFRDILHPTHHRATIQALPSPRQRLHNSPFQQTMTSLSQMISRFVTTSVGWLPLVQANTEKQSSIGIPDICCHRSTTSTDIDQRSVFGFALYSPAPSYHMPSDIAQCNNSQSPAEMIPISPFEHSSLSQADGSTCHQQNSGGYFAHQSQRPPQTTIFSGAVPDPTAVIQELQHLTTYRGAVPGFNLKFFDNVVSMLVGSRHLPYRLTIHRSPYLNIFGQGESILPTSYVSHRDVHLQCDTNIDPAVIQCQASDSSIRLIASSSIGPQDFHASADSTSSGCEALFQHQEDSPSLHGVSLRDLSACSQCDLSQALLRLTSFTGAVPDPTIPDLDPRHFTISRGAVPVTNSDGSQQCRVDQITGKYPVGLITNCGDEDLRQSLVHSSLNHRDPLSGLLFSAMGSASVTLQCQNSDISTEVEMGADDPLPSPSLHEVLLKHHDRSIFSRDAIRTVWFPDGVLQDTFILLDKNHYRLHQKSLHDTSSTGAVPDDRCLQLLFNLAQRRSVPRCLRRIHSNDSPVWACSLPSKTLLSPGLHGAHTCRTSLLVSHDDATKPFCYPDYYTACSGPSDSHQVRSTQESQLCSTASKFTVATSLCTDDLPVMLQDLQQSSIFSETVPVIDTPFHESLWRTLPFVADSGSNNQCLRQGTISSGTVPSYILDSCRGDDALLIESYFQDRFPTDIAGPVILIPTYDRERPNQCETPPRGIYNQEHVPRHQNNDVVHTLPRAAFDSYSSDSALVPPRWIRPETHHTCSSHFRGWSEAIYGGGHPAWGRCEIIHMEPNPPFAERCAAATQDSGWLASDEALWFLRLLRDWRSDVAIGPIIQWSPSRDLQRLMAAEDQLQCNNGHLNILLFLVEAHWCAIEIDRRTEPVHVVLIQWPSEHQTIAILEVARILQIPPHNMLVTRDTNHEVVTMYRWTILFRWYTNFAMQTCIQPLIHATDQDQSRIDQVIHRAQRHWDRSNAPTYLRQFATECRRAFMSAYARNQPETRLPNSVSTVMFVGPQDTYVQEVSQAPRPPTHREREINWLRNLLIHPAWLTNFEVELVLQTIRMQTLDRFLPGPLHFDPLTGQLESFVNDLPSVAGYTKVLLFITMNYHWISVAGMQHGDRWLLTAAVPDPRSRDLSPLFDAVAALLETSPDRVHIQAIPMHLPPHLCGWLLLHTLQEQCQTPFIHDATMLLQRIAVMPNSRIKTLIFEEALSTWTRHAPHQDIVTFATQVRTYFLAHMDIWSSHHVFRFGGMFPAPVSTPVQASWNVISPDTKAKLLNKIRCHVPRPFVCPCVQRLTAYIEIDRLVTTDNQTATFAAVVKPSPLQWASHFCQERVIHAPCSHVQLTDIFLRVPKLSASLIPGRVEAIVFQGRVDLMPSQTVISILDLESGLRVFRHGRNHATLTLDLGEFCSGAFSGWTQAGKVLEQMGYPITTKFAIDHDNCVATWYARNFTEGAMAASPEDVFRLRDEAFYHREAPITFQTDVQLGWYLLFCEPIEIATASPPCPAFSAASTSAGLEKAEGQVIVDTILKILILQPKLIVLEEVASLRTHAHFPLILELLNWGNFQVAWQEVLNLDDWLPQSRPRLILIAFRRCSYGLKHFACQPWPSSPSKPMSLRGCHCLLTDEALIEATSAPLDVETAKLYFDPNKVPGATPRSFKDTVRARLRTANDRIQCIMASYAYGHEIDATSHSQKGIFGSLLRYQGRVRFLAGPELLWLQGLSTAWHGPLNSRLLNHIVGNAISVPHALIGLINALGHFTHLEFDTFPHELFLVAMKSRLHAQNSDIDIDIDTGTFSVSPKLVPATAPWEEDTLSSPPFTQVVFLQGNKRRSIYVQSGLPIQQIFASLFQTFDVDHIDWLPFDNPTLPLPIVSTDVFWGSRMTFALPESYRLCLQEQSFQAPADKWTMILLPERFEIHRVDTSINIAHLTAAISLDRPFPYHLCNHMLVKWPSHAKPCQVMIARSVEPPRIHIDEPFDSTFLDMGDCLQARLDASETALFLQTCHASGVSDLLWSLGWQLVHLLEPHPSRSYEHIMILPSSTQLHVDAIAVRNILAAHVTTWYIPTTAEPSTNTVRLSLKLWATVIWDGFLPIHTKTDIFAEAWHAASRFLGPLVSVRSILRGKRMSPEESFSGYISQEDIHSHLNRVHLVGVLQGGGSKTDLALRTNQALLDFLLQNGASSITTAQFVKDLLTCAGATRIQQILSIRDSDAKLEQVKNTALHFQIALPEFADFDMDTTKRLRRHAAKRFADQPSHKATEFVLSPNLFHDAKGEPICNVFDQSQSEGVFLIDVADAESFNASHRQTTKPCIMVTLGPVCPLLSKQCQACNLPAADSQGAKVVIATCVHILGEAKAFMLGADQDDIAVQATSILAFTAWRTEMTEHLWNQLCEGPLKTIWKTFSIDPAKNVVDKPWGRSWRNDTASVDPCDAHSFQAHVRVYTSVTSTILAQSGVHGIFVNPKSADGNSVDTSFAVIWLKDKDRSQAIQETQKVPEHAGLVLSHKGKRGYGIRVPSTAYEEAQGVLLPTNPKQTHIPANCYMKLSPLPHGVTHDDIRTWLQKQALLMRPIRSLGANAWLLAASTKTDACHYLWGKSTVLLAPLATSPPVKPVIVAGGVRTSQPMALPALASASTSASHSDSWDPWAQWYQSGDAGRTFSASSDPTDSHRTWSSRTSQYSKSSTNTSTSPQADITNIQSQIRDLTQANKATIDREAKLRQEMHTEFSKVRTEMKTQIEASELSLRATLDQRIHCMERSLQDTNAGMKEGFNAILTRLGHPSNADQAKRPKPDGAMMVDETL